MIKAAGKVLSKTVRVGSDPRVKASEADLEAQLNAALELRGVSSAVNQLVARVDDLTRQLTNLSEIMRRGPEASPTAAAAAGGDGVGGGAASMAQRRPAEEDPDLKAALDELKKLRLTLVREGQFGYRYPPRLREEVNSLMGSITNPIAPPTEAQLLRLREVKEETAKATAELSAIINGSIKKINDRLSNQPHVIVGPIVDPTRQ